MGPRAEPLMVRRLMAARGFQKENSMNEREQEFLKDIEDFFAEHKGKSIDIYAVALDESNEDTVRAAVLFRRFGKDLPDVEYFGMKLAMLDVLVGAEKNVGLALACIQYLARKAGLKVEVRLFMDNDKEDNE